MPNSGAAARLKGRSRPAQLQKGGAAFEMEAKWGEACGAKLRKGPVVVGGRFPECELIAFGRRDHEAAPTLQCKYRWKTLRQTSAA